MLSFNLENYGKIADVVSENSKCLRKKPNGEPAHFGALIVDEAQNVLLASGYNGWLRGSTPTCGGQSPPLKDVCDRDTRNIPSGEQTDVGCIHAEENALANCNRQGVSTLNMAMIVSGEPCRKCAKLIVQSGISTVYILNPGQYMNNGLDVLAKGNVEIVVDIEKYQASVDAEMGEDEEDALESFSEENRMGD